MAILVWASSRLPTNDSTEIIVWTKFIELKCIEFDEFQIESFEKAHKKLEIYLEIYRKELSKFIKEQIIYKLIILIKEEDF